MKKWKKFFVNFSLHFISIYIFINLGSIITDLDYIVTTHNDLKALITEKTKISLYLVGIMCAINYTCIVVYLAKRNKKQ